MTLLAILFWVPLCKYFSPKPEGVYRTIFNENVIYTIYVEKDFKYILYVTEKRRDTLLYKYTGNWMYNRGSITFCDFQCISENNEYFPCFYFNTQLERQLFYVSFDCDEYSSTFYKIY